MRVTDLESIPLVPSSGFKQEVLAFLLLLAGVSLDKNPCEPGLKENALAFQICKEIGFLSGRVPGKGAAVKSCGSRVLS